MIGRIIVPVSGTRQLENKLNHAIALAGRFGSRVDVLFLHGEVDPQSIERNPFLGPAGKRPRSDGLKKGRRSPL
jgi:nucleotide-binding universal stress UspA family protein